jgi:hypothetical protein
MKKTFFASLVILVLFLSGICTAADSGRISEIRFMNDPVYWKARYEVCVDVQSSNTKNYYLVASSNSAVAQWRVGDVVSISTSWELQRPCPFNPVINRNDDYILTNQTRNYWVCASLEASLSK